MFTNQQYFMEIQSLSLFLYSIALFFLFSLAANNVPQVPENFRVHSSNTLLYLGLVVIVYIIKKQASLVQ